MSISFGPKAGGRAAAQYDDDGPPLSPAALAWIGRVRVCSAPEAEGAKRRVDARYINGRDGVIFQDGDEGWTGVNVKPGWAVQKAQELATLAQMLLDNTSGGEEAVVNCKSGISRSTSVALTALLASGLIDESQMVGAIKALLAEDGERQKTALKYLRNTWGGKVEQAAELLKERMKGA